LGGRNSYYRKSPPTSRRLSHGKLGEKLNSTKFPQ
jgi:hypothetical protein